MVGKRVAIQDVNSEYMPLLGTVVSGSAGGDYYDVKHDRGGFVIRHVMKLVVLPGQEDA